LSLKLTGTSTCILVGRDARIVHHGFGGKPTWRLARSELAAARE
jgi:hypothetical protein